MSLLAQARLTADGDIQNRAAAAAANEGEADPNGFISSRLWALSSVPGIVEAYEQATEVHGDGDTDRPGADPKFVTDEMLVDAVRSLRATE